MSLTSSLVRAPRISLCDGDGQSGKRVQVLYAHAPDRADRYNDVVGTLRQIVADTDQTFRDSAAETGGMLRVRWVHATDPNCTVAITDVAFDDNADDDNFNNTVAELQRQGFADPNRHYLVFVDALVNCGIANATNDDSRGQNNLTNTQTGYARVDAGCWSGNVAAHELSHTFGAVQLSAPHSNNGGHCFDEFDVMCYLDRPGAPALQTLCPNLTHLTLLDCNHDDYLHTSPPAGSYLSTHWNLRQSDYLVAGPQAGWGYVWANRPTSGRYTPSSLHQFNSRDASNTITRLSRGVYRVHFPHIGGTGGVVHVTAWGANTNRCKVRRWFEAKTDEIVDVGCWTRTGSAVDDSFTASFNRAVRYPVSDLAYIYAARPAASSYVPLAPDQFNSQGVTNRVNRTDVGRYLVQLPLLGGSTDGDVKVTAVGTTSNRCNVARWNYTFGHRRDVLVACFTAEGAYVDSAFTMTYADNLGITGIPGQPAGYVFADRPTSKGYTPSVNYNWRTGGAEGRDPGPQLNRVVRNSIGRYTVRLPLLGGVGGHVQVSAVNTDGDCNISSWGAAGTAEVVHVGCFSATGSRADRQFSMTFVRNTRG